jgi:hypothetical protein
LHYTAWQPTVGTIRGGGYEKLSVYFWSEIAPIKNKTVIPITRKTALLDIKKPTKNDAMRSKKDFQRK